MTTRRPPRCRRSRLEVSLPIDAATAQRVSKIVVPTRPSSFGVLLALIAVSSFQTPKARGRPPYTPR